MEVATVDVPATATATDGGGAKAGTSPIGMIPDELLLKVLSLLFGKTLMRSAPQVCKRWRKPCLKIKNVHLD